MNYVTLGRTDLSVSRLCLGTMTWGTQNTESEGHAQIDMARDYGVNFMDTAEMYPVNPVALETMGRTEEIIGTWNAKTGARGDWVLATKISGAGGLARGGDPITGTEIRAAVDRSLQRLQTDYIDLYQLHWPNRGSYHFRQVWGYSPSSQNAAETEAHMIDVLDTMADLQTQGKVRHFGLSNETAWGMAGWLRLAEAGHGPRAMSIQNEYSLLCRYYDSDLAELGYNEDVTLLAYSPLAVGLLTGKYAGDVIPEGSRRSYVPELGGRISARVWEAVSAYLGVAANHGLDPAQMAIAWQLTRPFPIIPIVGATSTEQLKIALEAEAISLSDVVLEEIAKAHKAHPMPY